MPIDREATPSPAISATSTPLAVHGDLLDRLPALLTIAEAARVLRIGRSLAYQLAHRYEATGGIEGLPVVRFGSCLRVPRWALLELITTGRVVQLADRASR